MVWRGPRVRAISPARPPPQKVAATDQLLALSGKRALSFRHRMQRQRVAVFPIRKTTTATVPHCFRTGSGRTHVVVMAVVTERLRGSVDVMTTRTRKRALVRGVRIRLILLRHRRELFISPAVTGQASRHFGAFGGRAFRMAFVAG